MTTTALKNEIHKNVDSSDEKILKVVHTILEEHYKLNAQQDSVLTDDDLVKLDKRWKDYKNGKMKGYTVEEGGKEVRKLLNN